MTIVWDTIVGLFVDDGLLAIGILVLVAVVGAGLGMELVSPAVGGVALAAGLPVILALSVLRGWRAKMGAGKS